MTQPMTPMKLYNAARSSASFRVRIALNLKGIPFDYLPVVLAKNEQFNEAFRALNPTELANGGSRNRSRSSSTWRRSTHNRPCCRTTPNCVPTCARPRCRSPARSTR